MWHRSVFCLFVVFFRIQESQWKELLAHVCQPVCLVSCALICVSEANPAEDLMGSFHSLFFSLGLGLLYVKSSYNMARSQKVVLW